MRAARPERDAGGRQRAADAAGGAAAGGGEPPDVPGEALRREDRRGVHGGAQRPQGQGVAGGDREADGRAAGGLRPPRPGLRVHLHAAGGGVRGQPPLARALPREGRGEHAQAALLEERQHDDERDRVRPGVRDPRLRELPVGRARGQLQARGGDQLRDDARRAAERGADGLLRALRDGHHARARVRALLRPGAHLQQQQLRRRQRRHLRHARRAQPRGGLPRGPRLLQRAPGPGPRAELHGLQVRSTPSLPHSLAPSLPHPLTHSLTDSLTHSFTHSLCHSATTTA